MQLNAVLEERHGEPTYFPFYRYGGTHIGTQQAYFVKFPVELFNLIPGIESARRSADIGVLDTDVPEDSSQPARRPLTAVPPEPRIRSCAPPPRTTP